MGPAYRAAARVIHRLPFRRGTLTASLAGRRGAARRWHAWAEAERADGPLVWAHAPSVGEALALHPILARLRARLPALQVALTHTSPSLAGHPVPAVYAHVDYLPLDEPAPIATTLEALRPALLLFGRGDLWPELVTRAAGAGVPIAVAAGTVRPESGRLHWIARRVLQPVHTAVTWVGAVSPIDADRWRRLGVARASVEVTGDPRHDQVVERVPDPRAALGLAAAGPFTVVAGSVEPADEPVVAGAAARHAGGGWQWLVVPHDPTPQTVDRLQRTLRRAGVAPRADDAPGPGVVVIRRRGVLADLYLAADAAYVGGACRPGRLHAVCEPAAFGVPLAAGPHLASVRDGALLAAAGAAVAVGNAAALARVLGRWARDAQERRRAGLAGRAVFDVGAAERTAGRLATLLRAGG